MDFHLTLLGTSGAVPTARRGLPATALVRGAETLLFDCGEGTQRQIILSLGLVDLDAIYLTHLHADHVLGLPGILQTFALRGRQAPLRVYGPSGLREHMARFDFRVSYPLHIAELNAEDIVRANGYQVEVLRALHPGNALSFIIREDDRPGVFDPAKARALGLIPGPEFGRLQRGQTVRGVAPDAVLGPIRRGRTVVISGDTRPNERLVAKIQGADLLIHEATFLQADQQLARQAGHSTVRQAAQQAARAQVGCLVLHHFSARLHGAAIAQEANAVFDNTIVGRDFDRLEIPFPEKGPVQLIR